MRPHIFETIINGQLQRHYSLESAVKELLQGTGIGDWYWNAIRRTAKDLKIGESYTLFDDGSRITRTGYDADEIFYYVIIEKE